MCLDCFIWIVAFIFNLIELLNKYFINSIIYFKVTEMN
jgi:hypothetical protein